MNTSSLPMASVLAENLSRLQPRLDATTARISSGRRLDRPAQDVPGLSVAGKLDSQQARLDAVEVNLQNGVSRFQVATAQLNTLSRIVTRLGELAALRNNPVQSSSTQALYAVEATSLQQQLRQVIGGDATEIGGESVDQPLGTFNGRELFGSASGETIAIGLHADENVEIPALNLRSGPVGDLLRQDGVGAFVLNLDATGIGATLSSALDQLGEAQARVGAVQSRLEFAAKGVVVARTNAEAALSGIRDVDIAAETTRLTRLQILTESHTAMVAQARDASAKLLPLLARR